MVLPRPGLCAARPSARRARRDTAKADFALGGTLALHRPNRDLCRTHARLRIRPAMGRLRLVCLEKARPVALPRRFITHGRRRRSGGQASGRGVFQGEKAFKEGRGAAVRGPPRGAVAFGGRRGGGAARERVLSGALVVSRRGDVPPLRHLRALSTLPVVVRFGPPADLIAGFVAELDSAHVCRPVFRHGRGRAFFRRPFNLAPLPRGRATRRGAVPGHAEVSVVV
mmetsp:Transcript_16419/g.55420  ORF Transcript_16419/g.55420 Transcript_16419/m.55420 type:complete len:226 (+) Transcript_16419:996-1673(+)